MTVEEELVRYLGEISFSDMPEEAIEASRREVLWTLASCVAGAGDPASERIVAFARKAGGPPEATVIGFGDRVAANVAGLANGAFAKALEYEDKLWIKGGGAYAIATAVIPASFAIAESVGRVDGRDLLRAVTLATDVQGRLVKSVPKSIYTGWNSTYLFSAFGAAIASGLLLGLTEEGLFNALGLAYAQATGNYQGHEEEGVLGVRMQMGFGVRNGITAAQMAQLGVSGVKHFLTGKHGLYPLFYNMQDIDMEALTKDLGREFSGTRLGFKGYPCCAFLHAPLDAVLSILAKEAPSADSIESVVIYGPPVMRRVVEPREVRRNPRSQVDAQFSIPWAVACAIVDRKISLGHFMEKSLEDRRYLEFARKVDADMDPNREGFWAEIQLKDGRMLRSEMVLAPKGHPDNPRTMGEIVDRYWDCIEYAPHPLSRERASLAKDLVLRLEDVPDVAEVVRLLC